MEAIKVLKNNKYSNNDYVEKYAALWSFGYLNNFGSTEGFYRTVNEFGFSSKGKDIKYNILDIGCGVGRVSCDYATYFKNSKVIGIDESLVMINIANKIVKTKNIIYFDRLKNYGFNRIAINGFGLDNIDFVNKNLNYYYLENKGEKKFDIITCINFIDRVDNLDGCFKILSELLNHSGILILASPLNFLNNIYWNKFNSIDKIKKYLIKFGLEVEISFDDLIYKEILDARGASEEYRAVILRAKKI